METAKVFMENYWIDKKRNKELYTKARRDLPKCQKFFREQLGWSVINNERIIKIEKIPARAEAYMGITDFTETRDYCLFCAVLTFLEDKEEQEQFLLSELVDMLELQLKGVLEVDWTSFTQRKSLVRVLQFCESMGLIEVYERNKESGGRMGEEILYENTGLSRYMAVNLAYSISEVSSYRDFEERQTEEGEADRGHYRINRVYRQLAAAPALYWKQNDDPDGIYLKNQRQWIQKNFHDYLGGQLHVHKNAAFLVMDEECFGEGHPREAMLPELVLLVCRICKERLEAGVWKRRADESIAVSREEFEAVLKECREKYQSAWSKEYREMDDGKLLQAVTSYMQAWMMLDINEGEIFIRPAAGKSIGSYPADFFAKEKKNE